MPQKYHLPVLLVLREHARHSAAARSRAGSQAGDIRTDIAFSPGSDRAILCLRAVVSAITLFAKGKAFQRQ